jgi:hypothetical protein
MGVPAGEAGQACPAAVRAERLCVDAGSAVYARKAIQEQAIHEIKNT